jgi:hypothetical protein
MRHTMLSLAVMFTTTTTAATAHAEDRTVTVKEVPVKDCNTDGGSVSCSVGTKTLAKGLRHYVDELALSCPGANKQQHTIALNYEYNDGLVYYYSHVLATLHDGKTASQPLPDEAALTDSAGKSLKKKPGLPACLSSALPKIGEKLLAYFEVLRQIDPDVDVRSTYVLKLKVE